MKKILVVFLVLVWQIGLHAQVKTELRVEPPFWWTGMKNTNLQLMVHGDNIASLKVLLSYPGISLESVTKVKNPNYLFINLNVSEFAKPGTFEITFNSDNRTISSYSYELKARKDNSANRVGFNSSDVIYLITPDRFVNGDTENDELPGMKEKPNRKDKNGRHGGDIKGITNSLDYLKNMGFTAVWVNPVLENNMSRTSYHGYSTTDFYKLDPRFGSYDEYLELSNQLKKRGMKLIMDMIFNHCGSEHWWMDDMPMDDWINNYTDYKITNHRRTVNQDPHASELDKSEMTDGWFVATMPDLNQKNPFLATYLIQNSIWWIEYAGLEGVRQDTWPYPDKNMMAEWTSRVMDEYPNFNIVGEEWSLNPAIVSYWQKGKLNSDGYHCNLPSLMDFPLQNAVKQSFNNVESWSQGLVELYEALANDFLYADANNLVVFPDNHDMSRFLTQVNEDVEMLKMGVAYFLTTRGIPQFLYGTEVLMSNPGTEDHGIIRSDFPGGWKGDKINAFTGAGLSGQQKEMQKYVSNIQTWRKNKKIIHTGKLTHFVPKDGVYVFFRHSDNEAVMVVLNKNNERKSLKTERFSEIIANYTSGYDIISSNPINDLNNIFIPARSAMIIELK